MLGTPVPPTPSKFSALKITTAWSPAFTVSAVANTAGTGSLSKLFRFLVSVIGLAV
jgi:hypothetical protein